MKPVCAVTHEAVRTDKWGLSDSSASVYCSFPGPCGPCRAPARRWLRQAAS